MTPPKPINFEYQISTGTLRFISNMGTLEGAGYSGRAGQWRNNPALQFVKDFGPVVATTYTCSDFFDDPVHGPCVCNLIPDDPSALKGRSGFMCHGDNAIHDASHGCIILARWIREIVKSVPRARVRVVD